MTCFPRKASSKNEPTEEEVQSISASSTDALPESDAVPLTSPFKGLDDLHTCELSFKDGGNPIEISINTKEAPRSGLRNRHWGILRGEISSENMHEFVTKIGWPKYVVCELPNNESMTLIWETGSTRFDPPKH